MPYTERLEEFREFIFQPIGYLIDTSNGDVFEFNNKLLEKYENIVGEARRNDEEYAREGNNSERFFKDMLDKVSAAEKRVFKKTGEGLMYKPTSHLIKGNCLEDTFLLEILETIQDIKKYFTSCIPGLAMAFHRKTNIPSFTVIHPSVLNDVYDQLINFGFINSATDKKDFINIFTGRVIDKPLKWLNSKESLAYFIKGVQKSGNIINIKNKEHWLVAQKCFINEEGQILETEQLRWSHPPADTTNLDIIISTFSSQPIE